MLFRSVVGKLWITIIVLVSAIFLFLSIFLIEYFDHYYYMEQSNHLLNIGNKISNILEDYNNKDSAITTSMEVVKTIDANLVIAHLDKNGDFIPINALFTSDQLARIYANKKNIVRLNDQFYKDFITFSNANDILALAIPIYDNGKVTSSIIIYQSLKTLYKTTNDIKKIILLFAGIGILLTTVFAFFLSTRITAPVREMKKAAMRMASGDFKAKVNIKTSDEIGDLALSFNQMANQLDDTVRALSSEKDKLANILESMADGVITVNTDGEIIMINPPAEQMLHFWHETDYQLPESLKELLKKILIKKQNIEEDVQITGSIFAVKMTPLYSGKRIYGAVTVFRDVTYERKLNKLRKDFLANISHELRTPISMIQGYSEAIIDEIAQSPEEKKELAQIIYDESLRLRRLVNDLLDLAKIESGNYQLQYCKADLYQLLSRMTRKFSALANDLEISLIEELDNYLPNVFFDVDRMEQVLTNLIDNALRHTPKGGRITLRAKRKGSSKIIIEVEDSGIGISEEDLPFVFERFYKADKARTRGQSGTGLGLSIVKNIIQSHEGNIRVRSKIGQGTTFSIILPTNNIEPS